MLGTCIFCTLSAGRRALDISAKSKVLAMTRDEILAAFDRIRVWQQGD